MWSSKIQRALALGLGVSLTLASVPARAGCESDVECKGDRICVNGECVSPGPSVAPQAAPQPGPTPYNTPPPASPVSTGWAMGAGIYGIVAGSLILAGTIATTILAEENDQEGSIAVGAAITLFAGASIPVVAIGASSARGSDVPGAFGLRMAGWIGYGLFLADAVVLIGLGAADVDVPGAAVASVGSIALISTAAFTADAFFSHAWASSQVAQNEGLRKAPRLALARTTDSVGEDTTLFGVAMGF